MNFPIIQILSLEDARGMRPQKTRPPMPVRMIAFTSHRSNSTFLVNQFMFINLWESFASPLHPMNRGDPQDKFKTVGNIEACKDVAQVGADCRGADAEIGRDLLVTQTAEDQFNDLCLLRREGQRPRHIIPFACGQQRRRACGMVEPAYWAALTSHWREKKSVEPRTPRSPR